jgi:hypothetical protein
MGLAVPAVKQKPVARFEVTVFNLWDDFALASWDVVDIPKAVGIPGWEIDEFIFESHDENYETAEEQQYNTRESPTKVLAAPEILEELFRDCKDHRLGRGVYPCLRPIRVLV